MYYAILGRDKPDSLSLRLAARDAHLARLQALESDGRLLMAGPMPLTDSADLSQGVFGTVMVAQFDSLTDAQEWANDDPYVLSGVFESCIVRPWLKVFPA